MATATLPPPPASKPAPPPAPAATPKRLPWTKQRVEDLVLKVSEKSPEKIRPYLVKAAPVIGLAGEGVAKLLPKLEQLWAQLVMLWHKAAPYHPEDLIPAVFGLLLAFFGGTFLLTIATVEAFRASGWDQTKGHLMDIYDDYLKCKEVRLQCLFSTMRV
jgi:hypothetical protein